MNRRPLLLRRLLMLSTATTIGAIGWTLLGDAGETADARTALSPHVASADLSADDTVVATVDGVTLTRGELEHRVAGELAALDAARRRLLDSALESAVRDALLDAEAARRGIDRETLLAEDVEARLDDVPDAAVDAAVDAVLARQDTVAGDPATRELQARRALRFEALIRELKAAAAIDLHQPPAQVAATPQADATAGS